MDILKIWCKQKNVMYKPVKLSSFQVSNCIKEKTVHLSYIVDHWSIADHALKERAKLPNQQWEIGTSWVFGKSS